MVELGHTENEAAIGIAVGKVVETAVLSTVAFGAGAGIAAVEVTAAADVFVFVAACIALLVGVAPVGTDAVVAAVHIVHDQSCLLEIVEVFLDLVRTHWLRQDGLVHFRKIADHENILGIAQIPLPLLLI